MSLDVLEGRWRGKAVALLSLIRAIDDSKQKAINIKIRAQLVNIYFKLISTKLFA